ncbi:MAG TPA: FmdB family zinc ribbon protein [Pusillimonas sp.]|uniref:FmdB family zinc ribbon protein n=1 Tax=unclassified Pusillimonas TaxID=2640016 RepID=UPI00261D4E38|nr:MULTISPECIES: FmdB family zinc ribbon protein [unclassified Pusillimonas]HLU18774.1 FmdB family zinc ribbon protein [Pusillimonas sp.]
MPIYAYKCSDCGHAQDVLQKMSDPILTDCPECGKSTYVKQVTAAGFQLKGSGWYVTDFRDGGKKPGGGSESSSASDSSSSAASSSAASTSPASSTAAAT